jgi:signal transduction histidine kinase
MDSLDGVEQSLLYCLSSLKQRVDMSISEESIACIWDLDLYTKSEPPPRVILDIVRIVNEAITNAIRHSNCRTISIWAREYEDQLQIEISDDGQGFDPANSFSGRGLANMKRRSKLSGLGFQIGSTDAGTNIQISFERVPSQPSRMSNSRAIA